MKIPVDILIERVLAEMQQEMQMTEKEKDYWREVIRRRLTEEGKLNDERGTE